MPSHRLLRVRELLKREIGETIRREFPVHQVGLVSVNEVEISGDLKLATVYVSVLGNADQQKAAFTQLVESRVRLQGLIGKAVVLKYTPQIRFKLDDSVVRGNRVLAILDELEKGAPEA